MGSNTGETFGSTTASSLTNQVYTVIGTGDGGCTTCPVPTVTVNTNPNQRLHQLHQFV
jgi:hypothetical protein